ncbi:MAG: ABC transporter permease subunit [Deferrisomatales bacterium]|nr:ABC transporter permease subunit [Deferrisomatales bacterium]
MSTVWVLLQRELRSYFATPLAYIFIAVFLGLAGLFTFQLGMFYEARQASLGSFFAWHPWLYLFLVPAISMRLWAEERKSGTIELLFTLPVSRGQAVAGKFLAGWALLALALALTFPMVLTVEVLGNPDSGQIFAGYLGSVLMAGAYLAIGCCMSALTRNQVIAFVLSVVMCFLFMLAGFPAVLEFLAGGPGWLVQAVTALSFLSHFESIQRGVIELRDVVFFASMMLTWLLACAAILDWNRAR